MKLSSIGQYYVIEGASDEEDCSMFNGMLRLFEFKTDILLLSFIKGIHYQRCKYSKYDFSRDQFIPLAAGYNADKLYAFVDLDRVNGKDFMSPTVKGHERRCQGRKANLWHDLWLLADLLVYSVFTPMGEPNQLICMLKVAGPKWVRLYKKLNPRWRDALREYWCGWRNEKEFCEWVIKDLESY